MSGAADRLAAALADRYRIERELGAGGMATVYLAEDLKHGRKVAIKVLRPELAAVIGAERFVREIRTIAALQHPHILGLIDSGEVDGTAYYVMPYVEGESLRDRLNREKQLPVAEAVRITTEVAGALDYAHRHGVIHRDIKPENILLHDGSALVADFGIALAVSSAGGSTRMTETGMSLGTPTYMSPEQAMGEREIGPASDVYALGCVTYEMLTGDPPFTGSTAQAIVARVVTEMPRSLTSQRATIPRNVEAAVLTALQKLPPDRFDSAKAFADALHDPHYAEDLSPDRGGGFAARPARGLIAGLSIALLLMTVLAGWALFRPKPQPTISRYALALPADEQPDDGGYVLLTSDGSRIVYAGPSAQPGRWQLWIKARDRVDAVPIAGTLGASAAAISPDDKWLAVVQGDSLKRIQLTGGASIPLAAGVYNGGGVVAWLDDANLIYTARKQFRLMRVSAAGGASTPVWSSDSMTVFALSALPHKRGVLFSACRAPCGDQTDLWVLDLASGAARPLIPAGGSGHYLNTGDLVYVRQDGTVLAVPFDLKSLRTRGDPVAVADSVSWNNVVLPYFAVSASGTMVTRQGSGGDTRFHLVWVDQTGRETPVDSGWSFQLTQFAGNVGMALSPDGTRLAIGLHSAAGDGIWAKRLPDGAAYRVSFDSSVTYRPRWTPDGRSITFMDNSGIVAHHADGTGSDSLVWPGTFDEGQLSPDGRWIVFRQGAAGPVSGGRDIYARRIGDSTAVPLIATPYDEMAFAVSPDSRWIAYQSDETGRLEVFVRPFPNVTDGKWQVSTIGGSAALWARDGRTLYYLRSDNTMMAVPVTGAPNAPLGTPRPLFHLGPLPVIFTTRYYTPWDIAPDGRFLMLRPAGTGDAASAPLIVVENWTSEVKRKLRSR